MNGTITDRVILGRRVLTSVFHCEAPRLRLPAALPLMLNKCFASSARPALCRTSVCFHTGRRFFILHIYARLPVLLSVALAIACIYYHSLIYQLEHAYAYYVYACYICSI